MRVLVMVKASPASEAGKMPGEPLVKDMMNFNERLVKAGVMLAGEGLHPSSEGKRLQFSRTGTTVVDGPFAETKELIAGYWIWKVNSMDEAVSWAKQIPAPHDAPLDEVGEIELRPIFDASDFLTEYTPDLQAQAARLDAELAAKS